MPVRILSAADQRALDAALQHVALFGRDDLLPVLVTGQDRAKFLHNMLTQEVKALEPGRVLPAVLCDAQGGMIAVVSMVVQSERIVLWTDRARAQDLAEALDKYVIMDEVELAVDEDLALVGLVGPDAAPVLQGLGVTLPEPGVAIESVLAGTAVLLWREVPSGTVDSPLGPTPPQVLVALPRAELGALVPALKTAGVAIGCHAAMEVLRILAGTPRLGLDVDDGSLPLEAGLGATVSYRKGCYLGQEAIAMMTYRGQMRRHLCWVEPLEDTKPEAGWALRTVDGKRAGRMGSSVVLQDGRALGLAMVQRKAFAAGAELVATGEDGTTARLRIHGTTVTGVFAPPAASAPADASESL